MTGLSVVIPVYRSEQCLPELFDVLIPELESLTDAFEVILVEDGGGDGSWDIIEQRAGKDPRIRGIQLSRNYGQHNALLCGIREAKYGIIVTIDDDLQNPPSEIRLMLATLNEGYDLVYGSPVREHYGFLRGIATRLTKMALKSAMGMDRALDVSAFRAFHSDLRQGFQSHGSSYVSIDVLLAWTTAKMTSIKVAHHPRAVGESTYTVKKLIQHAVNLMTGFSTFPLQLASLVGFAFTVFGFGVLAWVVGRYLLEGVVVPGFAFLASIIAIFSGAQLFALGIFGEYLARIHFRTMDRPVFNIRTRTDSNSD